jgi:5-formyltetrahydrofolate cyclo-ligase
MSTHQLVKSMTRSLTEKEQKAIVKYWAENKKLSSQKVIEHFEKKLKMPVTHHALVKAMITYGE